MTTQQVQLHVLNCIHSVVIHKTLIKLVLVKHFHLHINIVETTIILIALVAKLALLLLVLHKILTKLAHVIPFLQQANIAEITTILIALVAKLVHLLLVLHKILIKLALAIPFLKHTKIAEITTILIALALKLAPLLLVLHKISMKLALAILFLKHTKIVEITTILTVHALKLQLSTRVTHKMLIKLAHVQPFQQQINFVRPTGILIVHALNKKLHSLVQSLQEHQVLVISARAKHGILQAQHVKLIMTLIALVLLLKGQLSIANTLIHLLVLPIVIISVNAAQLIQTLHKGCVELIVPLLTVRACPTAIPLIKLILVTLIVVTPLIPVHVLLQIS